MSSNSIEKFSRTINELLARIKNYCDLHKVKGQRYGLCIANPKRSNIGMPTPLIQAELEKRAREYFSSINAVGFYFRYWTPPILPVATEADTNLPATAADYQLTFKMPKFDEKWQLRTIARSLIYCPLEEDQHGWSEWFEIQEEAITLTPLLHHSLKEREICGMIRMKLGQPGMLEFEKFVYKYAETDLNFPQMSKVEIEKWDKRQIDWKVRYKLVASLFNSSMNLRSTYSIAHEKVVSSRNPIIKALLWAFLEFVDKSLILDTELSDEEKKRQITMLREPKVRKPKKEKYVAKRPVVCISDIECSKMLYSLIAAFNASSQKSKVTAEAIIFIWIAQHAAFSEIPLKVDDILSIKSADVDAKDLIIKVKDDEINITAGLKDVLIAWIEADQKKLFQKLTYDNLEETLTKHSLKLFGNEGQLLPKDFLEKIHVVPYTRISVDLRAQLSHQERVAANSPYKINTHEIKRHIKDSIQKHAAKNIKRQKAPSFLATPNF